MQQTPAPEATPGAEQAAAAEAGTFAANMLGHLLFASRSVTFNYNRAAGPINVASPGSTSIVNPAVADDESPIPRDRVSFRFNYYNDAQQVTGFGPPVFVGPVGTSFARVRNFDAEEYSFYFEKTCLDGLASVELRVPFSTGLSNDLHLSAGNVAGPVGAGGAFPVAATPDQSLGTEGTQFGNLTLLFKGLAYTNQTFSLTAGLALGIPTGDDTSVNITDFAGSTVQGLATVERVRDVRIANDTWSLSPFLAYLYTPNDRFFSQGFLQFDFPLNDSTVTYMETLPLGTVHALPGSLTRFPTLLPPFTARDHVSEQTLMQVDWGAGYWLLRDPSRRWITGIAPTLELHYTTTLENADLVDLPSDPLLRIDPNNPRRLTQEQGPVVGNQRNRVDILDMTTAVTFLLADRATVAAGVAFPLKGHDDRTFDWEFQLQLNYYFGGVGRRYAPPTY
jgi:hypothetical protein